MVILATLLPTQLTSYRFQARIVQIELVCNRIYSALIQSEGRPSPTLR